MKEVIRRMFLFSSEPILSCQGRNRYLHGELKEFSDSIYSAQHFENCSSDRRNMHTDGLQLKKSLKKSTKQAVKKYAV